MANDPLRGCPTCGTSVEDADLGLRDYRWVSDALPGRVAPMDLDCVLERNGRVLILEFKPEKAHLPLGQRLTLKNFVRMGADVWVVWEHNDGDHASVGAMDRNGNVQFVEENVRLRVLRQHISKWYSQASEEER